MRSILSTRLLSCASLSVGLFVTETARAQTTINAAPPPDQKALVAAPKAAEDVPKLDPATAFDSTNAALSAGGQLATGNSRLLAFTATGKFDMRRGQNGFGAGLMANYGEGASTPSAPLVTTTENFQGRLRYDRYVLDNLSLFLIGTVRHDKFQGIDGRLNLDPGLKFIFYQADSTTFWAELGYDFQYDARNGTYLAGLNAAALAATPPTAPPNLSTTATDHSVRAFVGFKHAFNKEVTLNTGLEYLQSLYSSDGGNAANYDYRINFDALLAANVGAGFSLGLGFSARYDDTPLPGKQNTDTITTVSLIYAFSDIKASPPPPPSCPCPDPNASPPVTAPCPPPAPAPAAAAPAGPAAPTSPPAAAPAADPQAAPPTQR